jgi:putative transposase
VRKSHFTEAQIVAILKGSMPARAATELARRHGLHANTIRQWRDKYAGLETSDLTWLKQIEAESARKDRMIARLTMEVDGLAVVAQRASRLPTIVGRSRSSMTSPGNALPWRSASHSEVATSSAASRISPLPGRGEKTLGIWRQAVRYLLGYHEDSTH